MSTSQKRYNYLSFDPVHYSYEAFRDEVPMAGDCAVDFEARTLEGERIRLSDYAGRRIVLETGSVTCPGYAAGVSEMNRLGRDYPDVVFVVLYVREAHPGTRIGAHLNQSDKDSRAALLPEVRAEARTVLVDDVTGGAHQAYGSLPNSVFIIGEHGRILWRCTWNRPDLVKTVLDAEDPSTLELPWHAEPGVISPRLAGRVLRSAGWNAVGHLIGHIFGVIRQHVGAARLAREPSARSQSGSSEPCWTDSA